MNKPRGRPPLNERSELLHLRLPPAMKGELQAEAERRTVPLATAARLLIRERLDQLKHGRESG